MHKSMGRHTKANSQMWPNASAWPEILQQQATVRRIKSSQETHFEHSVKRTSASQLANISHLASLTKVTRQCSANHMRQSGLARRWATASTRRSDTHRERQSKHQNDRNAHVFPTVRILNLVTRGFDTSNCHARAIATTPDTERNAWLK